MKKTIGICFFTVCLLAGIGGVMLFRNSAPFDMSGAETPTEMPDETAAAKEPESTESMMVQKPFLYVLRERDGLLVVYEQDGETILLETNINVTHLAAETRMLLLDGIYVESEEELYDLLESYSS